MKKVKLITSLCSLGALTATTPIVATSCSNNDDKLHIMMQDNTIKEGQNKTFIFYVNYDGNPIVINELNVVSLRTDLLLIDASSINESEYTFRAIGVSAGKTQILISVVDQYGHKNTATFNITIISREIRIILDRQEITVGNQIINARLIDNDGIRIAIKTINSVSSSNDNIFKINTTEISIYETADITVTGINIGKATLSLILTDYDGKTITGNFLITVISD